MHTPFILLLLGSVLLATPLQAQCDYQFSQAQQAAYEGDFEFLKNFRVSNRPRSNGKPSTVTYSYIMTAGARYQLQLDTQGGVPSDWVLEVYPQTGEYPITLQSVETNQGQRFEFDCEQTGVFYLELTASKADVGCANLQLRYQEGIPELDHCKRDFAGLQTQATPQGELDYLKTIQIRSTQDSVGRPFHAHYTYMLKKGDYYEFQMENDPMLGTEFQFTLMDYNQQPIKLRKVETETGATYQFLSPATGVFYLRFDNELGEAGCAAMHLHVVPLKEESSSSPQGRWR
ncbi:MAG: hypothetical protein AAFQ98_15750 [Bacteroidota bacterium]